MAGLYVALGILGALCIVTAAVGGESDIRVLGQTLTLPRILPPAQRWLLFFVGVVFLIAAIAPPLAESGRRPSAQATTRRGTSGNHGGTTVSGDGTSKPVTPFYFSDLQPQGGDMPTRGDTQISDQDFPHSVFYDSVNGSNASACQKTSAPSCQATDYAIVTARSHQFSAMLGVTGCSGDIAHWSLTVDSVVVRSGQVALNSSPQAVSVAIPAGNDLELLVSTETSFSGAACGDVNIIWGNAKLS